MNNFPPVEEPEGYEATFGFVKKRPENNKFYLETAENLPWYNILVWLDAELEKIIPGYNIEQIKMKFGSLRFYFDYPSVIPIPGTPGLDTMERVKQAAHEKIAYAEGYVAGYEKARLSAKAGNKL